MKAVLTRVRSASVSIDGELHGSIGQGFLILLGVGQADAPNRLEQSAATIAAWERDSGATALLLLTDRAVAREELKREVRHLFHAHQKNLVLGKSVVMRLSAAS